MERVFILGGFRSHIGLKNGIFKNVVPEDLCAEVLKKLVLNYNLKGIDQIICGNAVGTGGNITRLMALKAGISNEVPAFTIDMQCASASMSIEMAYFKIKSGQCDLVIAGGFESSSLQPLKSYHKNDMRYSEEQLNFSVAQFSEGEIGEKVMLMGAERVALLEEVTKEELDYWSLESHQRATNGKNMGIYEDIFASVEGSIKDEGIREKMNQRLLDRLPPLLGKESMITAAHSCLMNDGAALVIMCSEKYCNKNSVTPIGEIVNTYSIGASPKLCPTAAMKAADGLLAIEGMQYEDMDAIEFNEAFAVINVLFQRKYPNCVKKYNMFGGALAYGHPYGASGGIILLHLLKNLEYKNGNYGICSIGAAGGLGVAILVKRVNENELF